MKKVFAILLSVLLVCALATVAFADLAASSCALTADKTELKRGDTFTVTAKLTNEEAVTLATVLLQYDDSILELIDGQCLATGTMFSAVTPASKTGALVYQSATVVSGDLYTFNLKVKADAPFGTFEIGNKTSIGAGTGTYITATGLTLEVVCDHSYGAWTDNGDNHVKTCGICGDVKPGAHEFGAWTDNGADHKATCGVCGGSKTAAHTFNKEVVADKYAAAGATCTTKATYYKSCECGAKGTETFETGATLPHTYDKEVATAEYLATEADCDEAATYYKSCACGAKGTATFAYGEPTGLHVYDKEVVAEKYEATPATCTQKGTYYKSCECGAKGTETFVGGELAAHKFDKEEAVEANKAADATCTSGVTYYKTCSVCGEKGTETFAVGEPIAHTFDKEVVDAKFLATEATCKAKATYYKSCACGAKGEETFAAGELAEHKFGEGKITTEPTAEKEGVKTYTCEVCGETKTEKVPYVETPATGDTAILLPMILLAVMSICGMAVVVVMKKRAA